MKKKYQVFISSTYKDLKEERAAVTQCLLQMECIPVGMEQFPASNMSQMEYIKTMIDDCDYYVLILAGKYGSTDSDGVGFTEKEYNYAIVNGIPVMSFVIDEAIELAKDKCESKAEKRKKLVAFRNKVCKGKLVRFYSDIGTLQAAVAVSLMRCIKDFPAVGWVRGDSIDVPVDMEAKFEKYMSEHTVSKEDIEALFKKEPSIIEGSQSLVSESANIPLSEKQYSRETISLKGACTIVEETIKRLPNITMD